jgi:hypothetical protein
MAKYGYERKTTAEFKKEVYDLVGNEYTILGEYITNKIKILIRHNCDECNNYEFEMRPNSFLSAGQRCPYCQRVIKMGKFLHTEEMEAKVYAGRYTNRDPEKQKITSQKLSKLQTERWANRDEETKERILENSKPYRFKPKKNRKEDINNG